MARFLSLALLAAASAGAFANVGMNGEGEGATGVAYRSFMAYTPAKAEPAVYTHAYIVGYVSSGQAEVFYASNRVAPRRRSPRWIVPNVRKKWYFAETQPVNGGPLVVGQMEKPPVEVSVGLGVEGKGRVLRPACPPDRD